METSASSRWSRWMDVILCCASFVPSLLHSLCIRFRHFVHILQISDCDCCHVSPSLSPPHPRCAHSNVKALAIAHHAYWIGNKFHFTRCSLAVVREKRQNKMSSAALRTLRRKFFGPKRNRNKPSCLWSSARARTTVWKREGDVINGRRVARRTFSLWLQQLCLHLGHGKRE